ncbi:MAG: tyrosine-type recombinase/integrase [Luteolibacter sp.]
MASIYRRPDSQNFCLSCYPRPGAKLFRASLGTEDPVLAKKVARKVDILIELEKLADVEVPGKILTAFECLKALTPIGSACVSDESKLAGVSQSSPKIKVECPIDDVIHALLIRSMVSNAEHATADKISRLRQFFGTTRINALDPRPPESLKGTWKKKKVEPFFKGKDLKEITSLKILEFFTKRNYRKSSKRHFKELFHEMFRGALKSGMYRPDNPYCANPAADLPSFSGRDEPINVLNTAEIEEQYRVVSSDPLVEFGCHLMVEGGLRLHEILALRHADLRQSGKIRLIIPVKNDSGGTRLKTGERTVTVRAELRPVIERFLTSCGEDDRACCFPSTKGLQMTSDAFGERLRLLNRGSNIAWTSQDYRHTYATNRIGEGWNLKTLADEMGTSIMMLMDHYAGYIEPPVMAALASATAQSVRQV